MANDASPHDRVLGLDRPQTFERELKSLLNRYSKENASDTPDFLLADYLIRCLDNWNVSVVRREEWYGRNHKPISVDLPPPDDPNINLPGKPAARSGERK